MDTLRGEDREVNHHGVMRDVGGNKKDVAEVTPVETINKVSPGDLRHRREDLEVEARKQYYQNIKKSSNNKQKLAKYKRIGRVHIPGVISAFVIVFWVYGLSNMK